MTDTIQVKVPDIGDFSEVEIIEVLVADGDTVEAEQGLVTLETDKAAMDVPAPEAGRVVGLKVGVGDRVSEGDVVAELEPASGERGAGSEEQGAEEASGDGRPATGAEGAESESDREAEPEPRQTPDARRQSTPTPSSESSERYSGEADIEAGLAVLGAGPGGYTAAFRAADLGLDVVLVERWPSLGGVCLNVGCIPSKALLHAATVIEDAAAMAEHGVRFGEPEIDPDGLRAWKDSVVEKLTGGLAGIAKRRGVRVIQGEGRFLDPNHLSVHGEDGEQVLRFEQCIIAAGSEPAMLPDLPDDARIMDSTGALELEELPERMLVVGGGIIGLEMACVYDALGVEVSVVELTPELMPGADRDLVKPLEKRLRARYGAIMLETKVTKMEALKKGKKKGIKVHFEGGDAPDKPVTYGRVLVAVGRRPNGDRLDADKAGVTVDERGFIAVDGQMRTGVSNIFAIGDLVGQPMLAHKASHEGKVAAEVAAGEKRAFDARVIPSVAYTDPEVAWVGVTEREAKEQGRKVGTGSFPWAASGRALSLGRDEGLTKVIVDSESGRIIGGGMVGPNAGELVAELALAIEMGADAEDLSLTIHPHPTLSETLGFAAEAYEGTITDLYMPKRKK